MKKSLLVGISSLAVATMPSVVSAISPAKQLAVCGNGLSNFFGFQPWYACLQDKYGEVKLEELNDVFLIIFPAVEWLVKAGALVAIGVIFFMLIQMIMARGDSGKVATATMGIRDAVIGFVICLVSIALVNFIANGVQGL